MNDVFIVGCIFWIFVMYLIHRYYKSRCYRELQRIRSATVLPLPVANGIEVQIIPNNSIVIDGNT